MVVEWDHKIKLGMDRLKILIAPFARPLRNGKENPKNYPYWEVVIRNLHCNFDIFQIGKSGEKIFYNINDYFFDLSFSEIVDLVKGYDLFISVDSFLPHLCHYYNKTGIVIFSRSNPKLFGYPENINLLKDEKYLRNDQFGNWEDCEYLKESFIDPTIVIDTVSKWQIKNI